MPHGSCPGWSWPWLELASAERGQGSVPTTQPGHATPLPAAQARRAVGTVRTHSSFTALACGDVHRQRERPGRGADWTSCSPAAGNSLQSSDLLCGAKASPAPPTTVLPCCPASGRTTRPGSSRVQGRLTAGAEEGLGWNVPGASVCHRDPRPLGLHSSVTPGHVVMAAPAAVLS